MAEVEQAEDIEIIDQYFKDKKKPIPLFNNISTRNNIFDGLAEVFAEERKDLSEQFEAFFLLLDTNSDGRLTKSERVAAAAFFTPETLPTAVSKKAAHFMS